MLVGHHVQVKRLAVEFLENAGDDTFEHVVITTFSGTGDGRRVANIDEDPPCGHRAAVRVPIRYHDQDRVAEPDVVEPHHQLFGHRGPLLVTCNVLANPLMRSTSETSATTAPRGALAARGEAVTCNCSLAIRFVNM